MYCFDRLPEPDNEWEVAQQRVRTEFGGKILYKQVDVTSTVSLDSVIGDIAAVDSRLDGLIAAAGIQQITPAVDYTVEDARKMMDVNFTGVMMTATACARQMFKYKIQGSMVLIASMSGLIANKGLLSPVYNCSKAATTQLARSLAME